MVFSFGATPAPAPGAPAPAPAAGGFSFGAAPAAPAPAATSTGTGGGFSFGATPAAAPTTAAPGAPAPAPAAGGFSFGAAPVPATTTTAPTATATPATTATTTPAPATGFSFGATPAPATAPAPVTTTASNPITSPTTSSSLTAANTNTGSATSTLAMTIPSFESSFPNLAMHARLETLLEQIQSPHATLSELTYHGQELMHLLSVSGSGSGSDSHSDVSFGQMLCNPSGHVYKTEQSPNVSLRNQLGISGTGSASALPNHPMVQLPSQNKPTSIPPSILKSILHIADILHLSEEEAGALYGASILGSNAESAGTRGGGGGGVNYALDESTLGSCTVEWFHKRHVTPSSIGGFVHEVIARAQESDCYVEQQQQRQQSQQQHQPPNTMMMDDEEQHNRDRSILHNAMDLYYLERGHVLQSLLMLLHHRISAANHLSSNEDDSDNNDLERAAAQIIFQATDPLLVLESEGGGKLITNLVHLVKDLTIKNEALAQKICAALDQQELGQQNGGSGGTTTTGIPVPAPATTGGLFGTTTPAPASSSGLFGGSGSTFGSTTFGAPATATITPTPATPGVTDQDYAMYEFTFQQRQLACQCLFYIAYHTQCEMDEVTSLLDLVKDLTNGSGELGTGLPILDPIRDIPDPYTLSWNNNNNDNNMMNMNVGMNMGMGMPGMMMQPQQIKKEKAHQDWKQELITSLWSVRGLTRATVTTSHEDFNGNRTYRAITRKGVGTGNNTANFTGAGTATVSANATNGYDAVIGGGKPQLMQCVTTLILTVMCALDGKNILMDRKLHGPNAFGEGNALIKAMGNVDDVSAIHDHLLPIRERLDASPGMNGLNQWKRQDIAGLLSASFALLLRPVCVTDAFASPGGTQGGLGLGVPTPTRRRSSSSSLVVSSDMNNTFRNCLESPAIAKSITFARLSLIPCLGTGSMKSASHTLDNDFAFYMSILADFTAQYLDAICSFGRDLPISRARWLHDEEQELQLRKVQEHRMKEYIEISSGQSYDQIQLPDEVDITKRPDCVDDMVALAVSVCSSCPECSNRFWKQIINPDTDAGADSHSVLLKPSKIMSKLEKHQAKDESLLPVYISFLSAVALTPDPNDPSGTDNGAQVVYEFLSDINRMSTSPSMYDPSKRITWEYVLNAIRWYAHLLNPPATEKAHSSGWGNDSYKQSSTYSEDSTAYYYGAEDNSIHYKSQTDKGGSGPGGSSTLSQSSAKKELDESSTMSLVAMISLISHVASNSSRSRREILDIKLPIAGGKRFETMEDDALTILFTLLVTSISPEIRGLTFSAIANLIRQDDTASLTEEQKEKNEDLVLRCWELLDSTQVIPIGKLSQYDSSAQHSNISGYQSQKKKDANNWFPSSEDYGILYEMESVENKLGAYPSTEGLLKLLAALFSSEICPSNLGENWRVQTGCSPYIEYVTDFVLPRIMQNTNQGAKLYFATSADKSRLVTRALEVIDAVITRYIPPSSKSILPHGGGVSEPQLVAENSLVPKNYSLRLTSEKPEENLMEEIIAKQSKAGMNLVISSLFPKYISDERLSDLSRDFVADVPSNTIGNVTNSNSTARQSTLSNIPRPKSPGFAVVGDILSSNGSLFEILTQLLVEEHSDPVQQAGTNASYANSLVLSLFGDTTPDFRRAKAGRDLLLDDQKKETSQLKLDSLASGFVRMFLRPLSGENIEDIDDDPLSQNSRSTAALTDAQLWKEHCILLVMRIICAAAARDDAFSSAMAASNGASSQIVPVMRFQAREYNLRSPLYVKNIQLTKVSKLILEKSFQSKVRTDFFLSILSQYIGYQSTSLQKTNAIASFAMSLTKYLCGCSPSKMYVKSLCGISSNGMSSVAAAFSARLSLAPLLKNDEDEISLNNEILDLLLQNLKLRGSGSDNLAHIILGLAEQTTEEKFQYLQMSNEGTDVEICPHHNALDAILDLISDIDFIIDPKTSSLASKCFEIIYHLCDSSAPNSQNAEWFLSKICVINKLRKTQFWQSQLVRFLGNTQSSESILQMMVTNSPTNIPSMNEESCSTIERDGDVLHCVSWLLKGVSLELHALLGASSSLVNMSSFRKIPSLSPQPLQCTQLLKLLLDEDSSIILRALSALPLAKPLLAKELLIHAPPRELLIGASSDLDGAPEICGGFTAIDPKKLQRSLRESRHGLSKDDMDFQLNEALLWARMWNVYVHFACASSHISKSWSLISSTIFTSCRELLLSNISHSRTIAYDCNSATSLLKAILSRINDKREPRTGSSTANDSIDVGAIYAISSAAIPLVQAILDLQMLSREDQNLYAIEADDAMQIISLLVDAILCSDSGDDDAADGEMAAIFASLLSAILESDLSESNASVVNFSFEITFRNKALRTASLLTRLSIVRDNGAGEQSQNPLSIARAARSGLSSLINWFNIIDEGMEIRGNKSFLSDLFLSGMRGTSPMSSLIHLVAECEDDIFNLVETIACCQGGSQLLVDEGITEAVLGASSVYLRQIEGQLSTMYGSFDIEYPEFIYGHVSLLNTMLSSDLSPHTSQRLMSNAAKFLSMHQRTLDRLVTSFPSNAEMMLSFATTFALLSIAASSNRNEGGGTDRFDKIFHGDAFPSIDRRITNFALHIAQFPFPSEFLSLLPNQLFQAQNRQNVHNQTDKNWWDIAIAARNDSNVEDLPLPNPPSRSDEYTISGPFNDVQLSKPNKSQWSQQMYAYACSAAQYLDLCLLYMINRVSNGVDPIPIKDLNLSLALSRCSETAWEVGTRLQTLVVPDEQDISSLLNLANIGGGTNRAAMLRHAKRIEIEHLQNLGFLLASCVTKLLHLVKCNVDETMRHLNGTSLLQTKESFESIKERSTLLMFALNYSQIEYRGVGCISMIPDSHELNESSKATAKELRISLSQICR